ncbi:MAG: hypothetical protein Q9166_005383 [cf. Caloplaca sp. 2 TL-2023]
MLNGKVYVVTSPDLVNAVNRSSKVLAFNPFIAQLGKRITGHDDATSQIVQHNLNGEHGPGYVTEIHDNTVAALADTKNIESVASTMLEEIRPHLDRIERDGEIDLFAWIRKAVTKCSTTAIYGPENPLTRDQDNLDEAFWHFDASLNRLILAFMPSVLAPRGNRARAKLGSAFQRYFQRYIPRQTQSSAMTLKRHLINTEYSITPWNAGRLEVGVLLGILANIIPAMFYTIIHILSDKQLLQRIRKELETTSIETGPDGQSRTLKVGTMKEKCHLLHATFKEVLRHHALGSSVRYVREDTFLNGRYLLKKGMVVQMPMGVLHHDPNAWGDDAGDFRPDRFLHFIDEPGRGEKQSQAHAFRPFGGGTSLCPGRHVAALETMALTAMMVLRFDIEPLEGEFVIPRPRQESMATNVFPPERDVRVRVARRQGLEGIYWNCRMD